MKRAIIMGLLAFLMSFTVKAYAYETKVCKGTLEARLEAYISELKIERARLIDLCFQKGEEGNQLDIAEYCGNYSQIDLVIHYLSKEVH